MLILLILVPLIWILRFKDLEFGTAIVLASIIATHSIVAISTQFLGIFKFEFLLGAHTLIAIITLILNYKIILKIFSQDFWKKSFKKIPWAFALALLVIFMQFYFVHFSYSGKLNTHSGVIKVENFNSGQPYFSDEWIAVGMSEKIIETNSLPFTNFLNEQTFQNFLFVFHSLISEIDLFFDLDLLSDYSLISIAFALILITFIYIYIRSFDISVAVSVISILLISYLPNSSNLPLLWYLLPWNLGLIFLIVFFIAMQKKYFKTAFALNFASMVFYPPIALLAVPSFIFATFEIDGLKKRTRFLSVYLGIIFVGIISAITFISFANGYSFSKVGMTVYNFIFRPLNSAAGAPPLFIIWKVLPWFVAPFAFWGLWKIRREVRYLSVPLFIGLILWFLYSSNFQTFLMDYHRIVAVTSILLVVASAFAFEDLKKILEKKFAFLSSNKIKNIGLALLIILFFILSFSFTKREVWQNFKTLNFDPAPPANQYLHKDDLELFKDIKNERFLSTPWKGLVLAVTTKNFPVISKPSTLTMNLLNYNEFINADCKQKKAFTNKFKIEYVYLPEFKCDGFELMGTSSEGLSLYLVK